MSAAIAVDARRANVVHVIQGEYSVSDEVGVVLCTLLGSCVSACIRDPEAGVGGLNHFLIPEGDGTAGDLSYGVNAMELLINDLLRRNARRDRLEAKLFGGARMIRSVTDIGGQNGQFAKEFLAAEGIRMTGGSLGGVQARRIEFWPATGRMRQQLIEKDHTVLAAELSCKPVRQRETPSGDLELF